MTTMLRPRPAWPPTVAGWVLVLFLSWACCFGQSPPVAPLPPGVKAAWDLERAHHETTPTRERICLNGLWLWQPAEAQAAAPPLAEWGHFKVPGSWPGITDYLQKDSQTVYPHPAWKDWNNRRLAALTAAWYQREFSIPAPWAGRRVRLHLEYLNSFAEVFVDGRKAGEVRFPSGDLDLTTLCTPGRTHTLQLLVVALPLKGLMLSYTDSASAREVKGSVPRRGLCGDVFLIGEPVGPRIATIRADSSVRRGELTWSATLENLDTNHSYQLSARVLDRGRPVQDFGRRIFASTNVHAGRVEFISNWPSAARWDLHTPQNMYELELSLLDESGRTLDAHWRTRLGFRELWIDDRDFYLNGSRVHLSAVPLDNAQVGAALSTYTAARESLERLKGIGINFVYTHNYDCEPGSHLSFTEILRAADDVGMLVALTQPHFSHYDWKAPDADEQNGYARHAAFYAQVAQEHPSVVFYAMSHNATGYEEDMNPDLLGGPNAPRDDWSARNAKLALRAEAIVRQLDPGRLVYHHASGNLGSMHPINFYPNFVPIQELSDWFGPWSKDGVKPLFLCEYGAPFTWDWTMYRGWYEGKREFGSAKVPWEFCLAEWNAQFLGDPAFAISSAEKANLRWEARQLRDGKLWHRWDYPYHVGSDRFDERYPIMARYLTDNWRAFRSWGVSAISPWEYEHFWKLREGVNRRRQDLPVDWANLQRPGFSPDYLDQRYERMDLAFGRDDWTPTPAAEALLRNNRPLLAWIAGPTNQFTSKDHVFLPGETVEKQLIVINDSREPVGGEGNWSLALPTPITGRLSRSISPGDQQRMPMRMPLPTDLAAGAYELIARVQFSTGESQTDRFTLHVIAPPSPASPVLSDRNSGPIALFDPKGETTALLSRLGVGAQSVGPRADLSTIDTLIVGKAALTPNSESPDIDRVRQGLKVIVFEQTSRALEQRFGFRIAEYGLRQVFARIPDHPIVAGVEADHWRDWRGEATLLPSRLDYTLRPQLGPTVQWCGLTVPHLWRCGHRGNIASVLIEKPSRGDFLPLIDGGFSLQYSPLLEFREGRGLILFCQLDVTARTEHDPIADTVTRNLLRYVANWQPAPARTASYLGAEAGRRHLESAGFTLDRFNGQLATNQVLILGPGGGTALAKVQSSSPAQPLAPRQIVGLGLDQSDLDAALPEARVQVRATEHIAAFFPPSPMISPFRGIGPGDLHNRDPREFPLIVSNAMTIAQGVLATTADGKTAGATVLCQFVPWEFAEPIAKPRQPNLRRTRRHASFVVTRLLANQGIASRTPILERFKTPVESGKAENRWLEGMYLDTPEEWDDPYRFFRW